MTLALCLGAFPGFGQRPNIVYILADDLGYGDVGCYGQKVIRTPNIDRLALNGMKFTRHYAGAPVCAPSRAVLMTGRDIGHARVRGNYESGPHGFGAGLELQPQDFTIAEMLKPQGYTTAIIGKWGLGVEGTTGEPNKQGFDYSFGFLNQGHAHSQFPEYLLRNGKKVVIAENEAEMKNNYSNNLFTDEALSFIEKGAEKPFFLYLAFTTPHAELLVPDDSIFQSYKGRFQEQPYIHSSPQVSTGNPFRGYRSQPYPMAAYAASITHMDMCIGKIIGALESKGLLNNTLIMFSSDNGPAQEGGASPAFFQSSGGLRGKKRDLYEGGIRVPFIVSWPGVIPQNTVSNHISGFQDVMPTLAEISGYKISSPLATEGISFYTTLVGNSSLQKQHDYLYWEFHENKASSQAVLMGNWKAFRSDPHGRLELYDLEKDPEEQTNVADSHPEQVKKMEKMLQRARTPHDVWPLKTANTSGL